MRCTHAKTRPLATARSSVLLPFFRFRPQVYRGWWWSGPTAVSRLPTAGPRSASTRGTLSNCCSPTCTAPGGRCVSLPVPRVSTRHLPALGEKTCHGGEVGGGGGVMSLQHHRLGSALRVFPADWAERKDEQSKASHHLRVSGTPDLASSSLGDSLRRLSVWPRRLHLMS